MKPDYLLCDVCGSKVPNGMTIFFAEGSEMDPSGNGYVDTHLTPRRRVAAGVIRQVGGGDL